MGHPNQGKTDKPQGIDDLIIFQRNLKIENNIFETIKQKT
jgi:hypothetical protein